MSNYTPIVNYAAKDALATGDPLKKILGTQISAEFTAIQSAISSKEDTTNKGVASGYAALDANLAVTAAALVVTGSTIPANGWYLPAANTLGAATSSTQRITINATGNVTVNAPTSGTALALPNTASANALTAANAVLGVGTAFVAAQTELWTTSTNPFGIGTTGAAALNFYTNSTQRVNITSAGQASVYEPLNSINALKNAATYETTAFNGTPTGGTTAPSIACNYTRVGNVVTLEINTGGISMTSNASTFTITGLPAAISPARAQKATCVVTDVGTNAIGNVGISGTTLTFGLGASTGGSFTASGTKGVFQGTLITYNLT